MCYSISSYLADQLIGTMLVPIFASPALTSSSSCLEPLFPCCLGGAIVFRWIYISIKTHKFNLHFTFEFWLLFLLVRQLLTLKLEVLYQIHCSLVFLASKVTKILHLIFLLIKLKLWFALYDIDIIVVNKFFILVLWQHRIVTLILMNLKIELLWSLSIIKVLWYRVLILWSQMHYRWVCW